METLLFICVGGAFVTGWVLGYYDIPNLKLSQKDAIHDYLEEHPQRKLPKGDDE